MNILIASAAPYSGLEHCLPLLQQAGLAAALPAASPAGSIGPNDWHTRLLAAQGLTGHLQTPSTSLTVGKMWEELAINLLLANMNQSTWGLADERATWVLPFWAGVDPQTRFALGHVPLGQAVALYRLAQPEATDEGIHTLAQAWLAWNTELLAFAQKMGNRAVLFNLHEATQHPLRLAHTCAKKLGLQQLEWQKLEGQSLSSSTNAWPDAADITNLRLPNLGAVRALQKKLDAATTALFNPNTQVMATPAADKTSSGWNLFGFFGKSKQLAQELQQTRFELQTALADLAHAQTQHADLQTQLDQTQAEHKRQTLQAAEDLQTEKTKAQAALKDQQQEGELLLQQLHQVQEELEQIFLNREEIKKQLQTAEKAKTDAEAKVAELDKKLKDLEKKAKDLDAAKAKADAANAELSKAKAELDKKAADAQTKASAAEKKAAELDKAKADADKKAADAQAKATAAEKKAADLDAAKAKADATNAELSKAKAEADKKAADAQTKASAAEKKAADLAAQLQSTQATLPEQTKALQEAQQENDLLLKQLHQVQEELESYFLKNKETDHKRSQLQERLDRVLTRLTTWADAEQIAATEIVNEKDHRCLRLDVQNLWVGQDAPVPKLSLLLGSRDGVPYMEFRPADKDGKGGVARSLLPWPEEFKDEQGDRLLIAPGAPGAYGKAQAQVVSGLSASQWRMVKGLLVLMGSQVNRLNLREQADRLHWVNITRDLTQQLDAVSSGVHFESAEVMAVTQPEAGTEVMRVAIRDLSSRNTRVPMCVFELGIKYKTLKSGPSPQMFFMDFRPWKGAVLPFVNFKPNSKDEQGEFLRISIHRAGRNKNKTNEYELDGQDSHVIAHIGASLSKLVVDKIFKRFVTTLGYDLWVSEIEQVSAALQKGLKQDTTV
ncbi:hypothetical protein [Limnohabitans sp. 15K]|uniref:hypothetical protein n=1 Tax=Limnohabitans sp. 15K TaxID=1100706 RepID=UPI000C1EF05C|nr:hypothetical protein [Limnohabitans sp. 15K]PIT82120.1 hypothetical protein B9Z40_11150 [Limnohabitans sp. 15K]